MKEQAKLWGQYRMWVDEQNKPASDRWHEDFKKYIEERKRLDQKYKLELNAFYKRQRRMQKEQHKYWSMSWFEKLFAIEPDSPNRIEWLRPRNYSLLVYPPISWLPYKVTQNGFMNWLVDVKYFPIREAKKMIHKDTVDMA
jgi:hypothetical protein